MAVDRILAAAFIDNNVRHRIFGRRLYPFSLWHRFLLKAVNSPFMCGEEVRIFDFREVAAICSARYPKCRVRRPWLIPTLCYLWFSFPRKRWIKFLIRTKNRLLEYFGDYISIPEYSIYNPETQYPSIASQGGSLNAPPPRLGPVPEDFSLLADVIAFLKCSESEAWNLSVGKAYWYQMAYLRMNKEYINFLDEEEKKFQSEMKKDPQIGAM